MTTIEYGGGPTLAQRRQFAGLKSGSHVPGYRGYCPQLKYRQGKTYGQDTHELSKDTFHVQPKSLEGPTGLSVNGQITMGSKIPLATGDNKYTESMVPGYTGYIPRQPFRFGGTYRSICDECIDDFVTTYEADEAKQADLRKASTMFHKLKPIEGDPRIRDHLNIWADTNPKHPVLLEDRRGPLEAPIPGYRGYIPRIGTTDVGLGSRYNDTCKRGLEVFHSERLRNSNKSAGANIVETNGIRSLVLTPPASAGFSRRLYVNEGMVPKYTGYVPRRRFAFGNTYGDTTRSMPVCAHQAPSYGEFVKTGVRG